MAVTIDGSNTPTAGGVVYGDGTEYASTAAGTSGQVLQSNGASAPSWVAAPSTSPAGSTGQVQYNNAGAFGAVSSGTSGQVLTSAGAGATPTWTTPSAGALVYISTQTVSGTPSAVDFTSGISSTYDDYELRYENVTCSTGGTELAVRFYKSGSFQTTGYKQQYTEARGAGTTVSSTASTAQIPLNTGNEADVDKRCGVVNLFNVNSASANAAQLLANVATTSGTTSVTQACGSQSTAATVTGIRFFFGSGGNFASGVFRLYGVAKA